MEFVHHDDHDAEVPEKQTEDQTEDIKLEKINDQDVQAQLEGIEGTEDLESLGLGQVTAIINDIDGALGGIHIKID